MDVDSEGNVWLTGHFSKELTWGKETVTSPNSAVFVVVIDSQGTVKTIQSTKGGGINFADGIAIDSKKRAYVTGSFRRDTKFGKTVLADTRDNNPYAFIWKLPLKD